MKKYEVNGRGRKSGRKRHRILFADDESLARQQAEADDIIIDSIAQLPGDPPTEKQLQYARDLGLSLPQNATKDEVSELIEAKKEYNHKPASERHKEFARHYGVTFPELMGKRPLFDKIFTALIAPGREQELVQWFVFRVYREVTRGDTTIDNPSHPIILDTAADLIRDESVIKSIKKNYTEGRELIWFGEFTTDKDSTYITYNGGSNQSHAYRRASSLLREKLGITSRAKQVKPIQQAQSNSPATKKAQGCSIMILLFIILNFLIMRSMSLIFQ